MSAAMLFRNPESFRETMPQTVPCSAGFSPLSDDFSSYVADSFDLSLLPSDGAVPSSPTQLMALYEALSPPDFHDSFLDFKPCVKEEPNGSLSPCSSNGGQTLEETYYTSSSSSCSSPCSGARRCPSPELHDYFKDNSSVEVFLEPPSRPDTNLRFLLEEPPAVRPNIELQALIQETANKSNANLIGLLQDPPVRSPSELRALLQDTVRNNAESQLLMQDRQTFTDLPKLGNKRPSHDFEDSQRPAKRPALSADNQLLREFLKNTNCKRKYNEKTVNSDELATVFPVKSETVETAVGAGEGVENGLCVGGLASSPSPSAHLQAPQTVPQQGADDLSGELARQRIEPVLSLALQHLKSDLDDTCRALGISPEPAQWTVDDVKAWLLWTLRQYNLPMIHMDYFNMDGAALSALTEEDFMQRAPQCGSTLCARLEVWKATSAHQRSDPAPYQLLQWDSSPLASSTNGATPAPQEPSEDDEEEEEGEMSDVASPGSTASASVPSNSSTSTGAPSGTRGGGSHIHLWQFLKELLSKPQEYGSCIRWLDRTKGVFKIEDSVKVAREWGKRKNRPAMNYDKLSRSIRQYYKKGIMKKTERSQRLVYQFCHPYCL